MRNIQRSFLAGLCLLSLAPLASARGSDKSKAPSKPVPAREQGSSATGGFTIEQVLSFSFPETTSLVAAPTGDRAAWVANTKGLRNIWGAEAPAWTARQITHYTADDGQEIGDVEFSGDGGLLVYVRGGAPNRVLPLPRLPRRVNAAWFRNRPRPASGSP